MKSFFTVICLLFSASIFASETVPVGLAAKLNQRKTVRTLVHVELPSFEVIRPKQKSLQAFREASLYRFLQRNKWLAAKRVEPMWLVHGVAIDLQADDLGVLMNDASVLRLTDLEEPVYLVESLKQKPPSLSSQTTYGIAKVGAAALQEEQPQLTGAGVRIAVIDTGIAPDHPDLKGKVVAYKDFSPTPKDNPTDDIDHGTHIAGTIAGGAASRVQIGVAPEAELVIARVFDRFGESTTEAILRAMHWVIDPDRNPETDDGAQVVNSSWATRSKYDTRLPEDVGFCQAIQSWKEVDVIAVFAAGNGGPTEASVGLPAGCPGAFSVGASEHNDRLMYFSGVGPARWLGFDLNKPEVVAPGFNVLSASANGRYREQTGTSMAAPHVAGGFGLLRQAFPEKSAEELMEAVKLSSRDLGSNGFDYDFGWGRVDLVEAYGLLLPEP